jgi:thiamine pyrophosphate-dependent acetolactate synthase large subunit-like protein
MTVTDAGTHPLNRREVVRTLTADRQGTVFISSLGSPTYDLAAAGDSARNFYLWGAMGGAMSLGLGLALARRDVAVCVLAGDGEILMGMGSFATIAQQAPSNLAVVILDNGLYGETGEQRSHTASGTDLCRVARACGIENSITVRTLPELADLAQRLHADDPAGPLVARVLIAPGPERTCLPSRDGVWLARRLQQDLGVKGL